MPIINNKYSGRFAGILPGDYILSAIFQDRNGTALFYGWTDVTIEGGVDKKVDLAVGFAYSFPFNFAINDLPGNYATNQYGYGEARIVSLLSGETSYVSWQWGKASMLFQACLPLNYQGGVLILADVDGTERDIDLPLIPVNLNWVKYHVFVDKAGAFSIPFAANSIIDACQIR